jgi:hypothetical protein
MATAAPTTPRVTRVQNGSEPWAAAAGAAGAEYIDDVSLSMHANTRAVSAAVGASKDAAEGSVVGVSPSRGMRTNTRWLWWGGKHRSAEDDDNDEGDNNDKGDNNANANQSGGNDDGENDGSEEEEEEATERAMRRRRRRHRRVLLDLLIATPAAGLYKLTHIFKLTRIFKAPCFNP